MDDLCAKLQGILLWTLRMVPTLAEGNPEWQDRGIPVTGSLTTRSCRRKSTSNAQKDPRQPSSSNTQTDYGKASIGNPNSRKAHGQVFLCAVIAWYLMKNASFVYDSETRNGKTVRAELWNQLEALANVDNNDNGANTVAMEQAAGCILRWYHSHSVVKISEALRKEDPAGYEALQINLAKHEELSDWWRSKAQKAVRLYGQGRFARQTIGHEIANLAALCGEVDAEDTSTTATGLSCLDYVKELVHTRRETDTVESGAPDVQRWDESHAVTSTMPRPAPWELSCLGHHLPGMYLGRHDARVSNNTTTGRVVSSGSQVLKADFGFYNSQSRYSKVSVGHAVSAGMPRVPIVRLHLHSVVGPQPSGPSGLVVGPDDFLGHLRQGPRASIHLHTRRSRYPSR